ncbi:MAG: ABC-ATPase domain-containing protein [Candidatus Hydrogenedentes bacterium]|nr:ABC-ATPase domain-containing protein [Candidatus Hydrogenedentota bacterium]
MYTRQDLEHTLQRIDGRGYKAYKDIRGAYQFERFPLHIDYVQGDPFAAPSKIRLRVPQTVAGIPKEMYTNSVRRLAIEDYLARRVRSVIRSTVRGNRGTGKSGLVYIDAGGQEVLKRTAMVVCPEWVEARMWVGLPAGGRRILGREAAAMLCDELPALVAGALVWDALDQADARAFVDCVENQEHIRARLPERALAAFVANGAILPRRSGASGLPLEREEAVDFKAPEAFEVSFELPNPLANGATSITGMGISEGVTLIVGGGYHGKSTLLQALEHGVYPHIPGDGREYVVTRKDAVKIRAEDGRRVENVDINAFISALPYGRDTRAFSSEDASGSTSQAANIVEALEAGSRLLLLDEDTSATNFMVRDARMQALVHKEHEPITPFLDRVAEMHETLGVSTILVMGGCGDYFDVADRVIMMREYLPYDATSEARAVADAQPSQRMAEKPMSLGAITERIPIAESFDPSRGRRDVKIDAKSRDLILFGREPIELRGVEQLIDTSQTRATGYAIHRATQELMTGKRTLREVLDALEHLLENEAGLDILDPFRKDERHPGNFAMPRKYEIAAAINRLRSVQMRQKR